MDKKQEYDISDKEALEIRKQEMQSMLPGFMTKFILPNSGKSVDVFSKDIRIGGK